MIRNPYVAHPYTTEILHALQERGNAVYQLKGLSGSAKAGLFHAVASRAKGNHLVLFHDKEFAAYFYTDLVNLEGTASRTLFFPSSYKRSVQYLQTDEANIITRTQTLKRLNEQRVASFIISYAEALLEKVLTRAELGRHTLEIKTGESLSREFMQEVLDTYGFKPVDFVYEPGQYAIRGGIVDIFSFSSSSPWRIDFFGDEVDSIRSFDPGTQRSRESVKKISVIPNVQWEKDLGEKRVTFLEYIPSQTILWTDDLTLVMDRIEEVYKKTLLREEEGTPLDKEDFLAGRDLIEKNLSRHCRVEFGLPSEKNPSATWQFSTSPQPPFNKNFELLAGTLSQNSEKGITNYILSENTGQIERLRSIFDEIDPTVRFEDIRTTVHEGFIDHDLRIAIYTDHQIFERYHKFRLQDQFTRKEALSVKELMGLNPGD